MSKKILIAYFSASGVTAKTAQSIADKAMAALHEIEPVEPYTQADLNWMNKNSRSTVEMNDPASRPAIVKDDVDTARYDVIAIGFPIWWYVEPRIIDTFIECHDLKGKKVVPFATSGGSSIAKAEKSLKEHYPEIDWQKGTLLNGGAEAFAEQLKNL